MPRLRLPAALLLAVVAVLGAIGCSGDDERSSGDTRDSDRERSADCDRPSGSQPTEGPQTFTFDGEERAYLLSLPDDYDATTAHPLVLNFHGFAIGMERHEDSTAMGGRGARRGYVVVTPDALGEPQDWNYFRTPDRPDDFGFVDALVTDLTERLCIDRARIYATGHSAGSAFTGFLACAEPYHFAAVAMVAAFIPTTCAEEDAAPSVVAVHGTEDPLVPYDGGQVSGGPVGIPAVTGTFDQYADAYSCQEPPVDDEPAPGVEHRSLGGCRDGHDVELYTVVGGGHEWPGADGTDAGAAAFSATDVILDFFDTHTK